MRRLFIAFLLLSTAPIRLQAQTSGPDTIVYLVRHGETQGSTQMGGSDPELSAEGLKRAQELSRMLGHVGVNRVLSTNLHRTLATATPVAQMAGVKVELYDPQKGDEFALQLRSKPGIYLVSGHSNTTPEMVTRLGGEAGSPIEHWEYDRLYVLVFKAGSSVPTTIQLRYGEVSKAPAP